MTSKVSKWGNSLGLRLPKSLIQVLNLKDGSEVTITQQKGRIIIEPIQADLSMDELLVGMTETQVLSQYESTEARGKEKFWEDE